MPVYEYFCRRCAKPFVALLQLAEHHARPPECPRCRRRDAVRQCVSAFTPVTSRKSART